MGQRTLFSCNLLNPLIDPGQHIAVDLCRPASRAGQEFSVVVMMWCSEDTERNNPTVCCLRGDGCRNEAESNDNEQVDGGGW